MKGIHATDAQRHAERTSDGRCDIFLDREDICQLAIIGIRPKMVSIGRVNKLSRDENAVTVLADTAFENKVDVERLPNRL